MGLRGELEWVRGRIAEITCEIVRLCGERVRLVRRVGELKVRLGLGVEDREVEDRLRRLVLRECRSSGLSEEFGLKLLDLLLDESKRVQREIFGRLEGV